MQHKVPVRRSNIDDAIEAPPFHPRRHRARGVERGGEIDREDRVPAIRREVLDRRDMRDTSTVHQDGAGTESANGALDQAGDLAGLGQVGVVPHRYVMRLDQAPARGLDLQGRAETVQHHGGATRCEVRSGRPRS
ncbi:MAG TPA: hypothetical protein VE684_06065 [Crenalkalicoccus sp.]|jgi:hypothetical protein|nr:hypothetical protein [Crenalkalicoccus sp.]